MKEKRDSEMGKNLHGDEDPMSPPQQQTTKPDCDAECSGSKPGERIATPPFKRLPFFCCSLSFAPFENPVCTPDGSVFDLMNIVPYIKKYGTNPVSGGPLKQEDLITLKFHKNFEGEFHCPVLYKVFTKFTHIVAVKTTGNVFCYEAVKELNLKSKNWKELLTDEAFTKEDLITIQNPRDTEAKAPYDFDHVKKGLTIGDEGDPSYHVNVSGCIKQLLDEHGTD